MPLPEVILVGPFPPAFLDRLTGPLQAHGAEFRILTDPERIEAYHQARLRREPSQYASYDGHDMVYLEVPRQHILIIRPELEKLGVSLKESDFDPGFHELEYLCPHCDHHTREPGLCPVHRTPLLEFSQWVDSKRQRGERGMKWFVVALIIVALIFVWWMEGRTGAWLP